MSPTEQFGPLDEHVRVQAADWFARMRGPDAETSRPAFDAWYAEPAHARAYEQLVGRWEQSAFINASRTGRERRLGRASFISRYPGLSAAAALICTVAGSALFYAGYHAFSSSQATAQAAVRYESGTTIRDIALRDGTHLTLDRASLVLVSYTPERRIVELAQGRARFAPASDAARPFSVHAGAVEATGDNSVFDISYGGQASVVSTLVGQVSVRSRKRVTPVRLVVAGQQMIVRADGKLVATGRAPGWNENWPLRMIDLDHASLADAALQVGRGASTRLLFSDESSALLITGTFRAGDVEALARAAQAMFHLQRTRDAAGNIVLSRQPQTEQH